MSRLIQALALGAMSFVLLAEPVLAQNTGAVRRGAAGDGNMDMSEGIRHRNAEAREELEWNEERAPVLPKRHDEPEHGGVGTDMEHRQRYDPRNDDRD